MITIACVRTGTKYGIEYVEKLRNMVKRHLGQPHRFICLTDQPDQLSGVEMIQVRGLDGWWAKMALFDPILRGPGKCLFFDLDTVIIDDLKPLADLDVKFGICANFTKAVSPDYPCSYGSCVMVMREGFGADIWREFEAKKQFIIQACRYGDQQAIEMLYPNATYLQDVLPDGYLVGRREFKDERPAGAAIMIFAGKHKPHNTPHKWLKELWQ